MTLGVNVVELQGCFGRVQDGVVSARYRVGVVTVALARPSRTQAFGGTAPLGNCGLPAHATWTPSRVTARWKGEPRRSRSVHSVRVYTMIEGRASPNGIQQVTQVGDLIPDAPADMVHDDQHVEVAIRAGIAAGLRAVYEDVVDEAGVVPREGPAVFVKPCVFGGGQVQGGVGPSGCGFQFRLVDAGRQGKPRVHRRGHRERGGGEKVNVQGWCDVDSLLSWQGESSLPFDRLRTGSIFPLGRPSNSLP